MKNLLTKIMKISAVPNSQPNKRKLLDVNQKFKRDHKRDKKYVLASVPEILQIVHKYRT